MGSFGERLRREREMRGITLDEISKSTKISRRHLEELETDNFEALPGGVFNRGFVRAYARYLGMDEDQAVADYAAVSGEQAAPENNFPIEVPPQPDPRLNPRRSSWPLILAILALVAVLAVFWARNKGRQPETTQSPAPAATATPAPSAPLISPSPNEDSSRINQTTTQTGTVAAPPSPAKPQSVAAKTSSSAATGFPSLNSSRQSSPAASPSPERIFSVTVAAKEDTWIMVTADGKTVVSGKTMKTGEQQVVRAGQKIVLVTGNAGGVEISFNGKPLGPVGNESEVRTLTFTSTGLVQ